MVQKNQNQKRIQNQVILLVVAKDPRSFDLSSMGLRYKQTRVVLMWHHSPTKSEGCFGSEAF